MRFAHIVFAVLVLALFASRGAAQDPKDFARLTQPGPEHERLHALVGKWTLTMDGGMAKGTAEFKKVLGGRFVTEEAKLPLGGVTLEWLGVYGFDKQKKKYTAFWVDSLDTTTESGEGDMDAAGKVLSLRGQHLDPRSGKPERFVWRISRDGDAKIVIEMLGVDKAGKEQVIMTVRGEKAK
jgi:Protein of unknown function (DUF1579)